MDGPNGDLSRFPRALFFVGVLGNRRSGLCSFFFFLSLQIDLLGMEGGKTFMF